MTDLAGIASTADTVITDIMKVEPTVAGVVGMFVPGAAPIVAMVQPWIVAIAPKLEATLAQLAAGHNGDALAGFASLISHLTAGMPNSPILAPQATNDPTPVGSPA